MQKHINPFTAVSKNNGYTYTEVPCVMFQEYMP